MRRSNRFIVSALSALLATAALAPVALAQLAPGAAGTPGEAPGGAQLAPMPSAAAVQTAQTQPVQTEPGSDEQRRGGPSMSFAAGGQECRETVPGGNMLAIAYAVVLFILGAYVALLARKSSRLATDIDELEAELGRKRGDRLSDDDGRPSA